MGFPSKTIYLAGPITGLNYNDARNGWRKKFAGILAERDATHIHCFSPMREKEFLEKDQCIGGEANYESLHGFGTPQGILTRDHNDVRNCDVMVANFVGATRVSIGTCVEFGFAHSYRKPAIIIMEPERTIVTQVKDVKAIVTEADIVAAGGNFSMLFSHDIRGVVGQPHKGKDIDGNDIEGIVQHAAFSPADKVLHMVVRTPAHTETVRNPHDHVFLRACAGYVVPTLEHAADIAQSLLTPGL